MNFIHISTVGNFNTAKFAAVPTNDRYFTGADLQHIVEGTPTVLYDDMAFCKEVKLIYTHGTFYKASDTDLTNYYTKDEVDSTFAAKSDLSTKQNQITGNLGDVVYHNGTNVFTQPLMNEGYVVNTIADLNKCKNNVPTPSSVLNSWKRFSILNGASNSRPTEVDSWTFEGNTLIQPLDSESFSGIVSAKSYSNYEVVVRCSSTGSDSATLGIVAAYAVDSNGREHTLSFLRTPGGSSNTVKPKWSVILNFNGSFESTVYNQSMIIDNSSAITVPTYVTNWNNAAIESGTVIRVKRTGNVLTAMCSQFGSDSIDNNTLITLDLDNSYYTTQYPLLKLFKGSSPWGYACFSQPDSRFNTTLVTDPNHYIYDLTTNSVLEYNSDSEAWVTVQNKTPKEEVGIGRFSFNKTTDKLFYNNGIEIVEVSRSLGTDTPITDVEVNGSSVVVDGIAKVTIPSQVQADWNEVNISSKAYIQNKPTIPPAQVQSDWNETNSASKSFIQNKPTIPAEQVQSNWDEEDNTSKSYIQNKPFIPPAQVQSDWNEEDATSKAYIQNKPYIPSEQVQANWNELNATSKAYIQNKPTIPPPQVQVDWNETDVTSKAYIQNKPYIPGQVQPDWEETDVNSKAYIQNKPTIPEQVQSDWEEEDVTSKAYIQNKPEIPSATTVTPIVESGIEIAQINGTSIYTPLNSQVYLVSASSINDDLSNLSTTGLNVNDLVIITGIRYTFSFTQNSETKILQGPLDFDLIFRWTGTDFRPVFYYLD
jgi:hypothetical protein